MWACSTAVELDSVRAVSLESLQCMCSKVTFEYNALKEDEIRLLEILPGSDLERVSCRLRHASLINLPEYAALSYTWGGEATDRKVTVNDQILLVKPNLEAPLREFQRKPVWFVPKKEPYKFRAVYRSLMRLSRGLSESQWHCKELEKILGLTEDGKLQDTESKGIGVKTLSRSGEFQTIHPAKS